MGALCGTPATEEEASQVSNDIDKQLQKDSKLLKKEIKLLLLGAGESGKSTIFKQMKIIQKDGGYTKEELSSYRSVVFNNCLTQMKVILNAAQKLGIEFNTEEEKEKAAAIGKIASGGEAWSKEIGQDIKVLWQSPVIQHVYSLRDKHYQLNDSAQYFFDNVDRFIDPNYLPTVPDVLRSRVRSTGIDEAQFKFEDIEFRMLDVGGQRSERRKWIHCFDCVTAVIFCTSLSEYDQTLREDETQNRMLESIKLFEEVCNSPWFNSTSFIIFFNKTDLFKEKILKVDLTIAFPEYTGGCNYENASEYIKAKFMEKNTSPHTVYTHYTCAINTENITFVFLSVKETILKSVLSEIL